MVHTLDLRPVSDVLKPAVWTPVGGPTTLWQAWADGTISSPNDSTYACDLFDYAIGAVRMGVPTDPTYLASELVITGVRIVGRVALYSPGYTSSVRAYLTLVGSDLTRTPEQDFQTTSTGYETRYGAWHTTDPYGRPWTKDLIATPLDVGIFENNIPLTCLSTLTVQVGYVLAPTTSAVAPSGTVDTATPTVTWTRAHDEGLTQAVYQVRAFDYAAYTRGDFDPRTTPPVYDSGEVASNVQAWTVPSPLPTGTSWKWAVRTAVTAGGRSLWSPWAVSNAAFVSYLAPSTPRLTADAQIDAGRVRLDVTGTDNLLTTHDADLERETGVGSWTKVTSTMNVTRSSAQAEPEYGAWSLNIAKTTSSGDMEVAPFNLAQAYAGEQFIARAAFRNGVNVRNVGLRISFYNVLGTLISSVLSNPVAGDTTGWVYTYHTSPATAPAGTAYVGMSAIVYSAGTSGGESHWIDQVGLFRRSSSGFHNRGGFATRNLLPSEDSDFEATAGTFVALGTNTTVARSTTVGGFHGSAALRLTVGASTVDGIAAAADPVPIRAGGSYFIIGNARAGSSAGDSRIGVEWFDGDGNSLGVNISDGIYTPSGSWTALYHAVDAPAGAATAAFRVAVDGPLTPGNFYYFDTLSIAIADPVGALYWSRGQDSPVSAWFVVEFSDDDGETWAPIRDGDVILPNVYEAATLWDYEILPGVIRRYRARTEATDPYIAVPPAKIASDNSAEVYTSLPANRWWLKSITEPTTSLGFSDDLIVPAGTLSRKMDERSGRFVGIGSEFPVFVSDSVGGQDGTIGIRVYGETAWTAFLQLLADPAPLYLVDPIVQEARYIKVTDRKWDEKVVGSGVVRDVTLDYEEVARP